MIVIGKQKLLDFMEKHADARSQVESWVVDVEAAAWTTPHELRSVYPKVSLPGDKQAIFDIGGSNYRLWVRVEYERGIVFVKEIGTHKEYEKWAIK